MEDTLRWVRYISILVAIAAVSDPLAGAEPDAVGLPGVHESTWPAASSPVDDPAIALLVDSTMARMTLLEKVGQTIQGDMGSVTPADLADYPLGSVLNGGDSGPNGDNKAPPSAWLQAIASYEAAVAKRPGAKIPLLWGTDAVHGQNKIVGATIFPHNIGLGAAHDPAILEAIGAATAEEVAATGPNWVFAPALIEAQDARWGRTYESYSQDPAVVASYAAAIVQGLQGAPGSPDFLRGGHVVATAKHFLGDGGTTGGVDEGDTVASEQVLRDVFNAGYPPAITAGVQTIMVSYSSWNGAKMHGNRQLLVGVLNGRMGFRGFTIGDWNGHAQVPGCTPSNCPAAFNAGVDMTMAPTDWKALFDNMVGEVRSGVITETRLDDAVRRILTVKARAGLLGAGAINPHAQVRGDLSRLGAPAHRDLARRAVRESLVLLKNDGLLPLRPRATVLVIGPGADNIGMQCGGWTLSWQGAGNANADFPNGESIYAGLRDALQKFGGSAVLADAIPASGTKPDAAVVVFGEQPYAEMKGDLDTTDFSSRNPGPLALLSKLKAMGIPTVSVFLSGRPLWVDPELELSNAFVAAFLPGSEGGGVADILVADESGHPRNDFSGRLSFTWPAVPNQITGKGAPRFPLNFGLRFADKH
jgi:beta-glucosidase